VCARGVLSNSISKSTDAIRQIAFKTSLAANRFFAGMFESFCFGIYRLQLTSVLPTGNRAAFLRSPGGKDADRDANQRHVALGQQLLMAVSSLYVTHRCSVATTRDDHLIHALAAILQWLINPNNRNIDLFNSNCK
jgi:hypothetical protein